MLVGAASVCVAARALTEEKDMLGKHLREHNHELLEPTPYKPSRRRDRHVIVGEDLDEGDSALIRVGIARKANLLQRGQSSHPESRQV